MPSILIQCTSAQSEPTVPAAPVARAETGNAARHKEQGKDAAVAKCFLAMTVLSSAFLHVSFPELWSYRMPCPTLSPCTSPELLSPLGHSPKCPPCPSGLKAVLPTNKLLKWPHAEGWGNRALMLIKTKRLKSSCQYSALLKPSQAQFCLSTTLCQLCAMPQTVGTLLLGPADLCPEWPWWPLGEQRWPFRALTTGCE